MSSTLTTDGFSPYGQCGTQFERLAALARDLNSSPKDWVMALASIPGLSSHILQIVNACYGGLPGRIASIHQAIVLLGFNTVKHLASRLVFGGPKASPVTAPRVP